MCDIVFFFLLGFYYIFTVISVSHSFFFFFFFLFFFNTNYDICLCFYNSVSPTILPFWYPLRSGNRLILQAATIILRRFPLLIRHFVSPRSLILFPLFFNLHFPFYHFTFPSPIWFTI